MKIRYGKISLTIAAPCARKPDAAAIARYFTREKEVSSVLTNLAEACRSSFCPILTQAPTQGKTVNYSLESRKSSQQVLIDLENPEENVTKLEAMVANSKEKIKKLELQILEIIGNIRKQKNDIDEVLWDTRELQKPMNTVTGKLDRQFTISDGDNLIYRTANRDENSRKAYKLLATLYTDCAERINYVQETGAITREIRDRKEQIEKDNQNFV
ncbi:hypothetical protein DMENIID0001_134940 [Sergentomyia squamirostris]